MALVILGKTTCGICGRALLKGEDIASFSPFVTNEADPLHFFSDAAFHESCLATHPRAAEARKRASELRSRTAPGCRKCVVCNEEIRDPDDYLSFGYIAEQPDNLQRLNYLQFHRRHLPEWSGLRAAHDALVDVEASGVWKGPGLRWIIEQLGMALTSTAS